MTHVPKSCGSPRVPLQAAAFILIALVCASCSSFHKNERKTWTPEAFRDAQTESVVRAKDSPYLKAHMKNGDVYVLENWSVDDSTVTGQGVRQDALRNVTLVGHMHVPVDSVALFETNVVTTSSAVVAIAIVAGVTAVVAIICAINPKECFGSCPTFYFADLHELRPRAEGFSASIAPSLEAADIDDLRRCAHAGEVIDLEMRNEALETHVVQRVDLLAVPHAAGQHVVTDDDGRFWIASHVVPPVHATSLAGDCTERVVAVDDNELFTPTDSTDLGARETVSLDFEGLEPGRYAVVVTCRQSLLTTYLLYQTFAYMGREAGTWLASVERGETGFTSDRINSLIGCMDVRVTDAAGVTHEAGSVCEYGPIATDVHALPLQVDIAGSAHVVLEATRGNWRIDAVTLARLDGEVTPIRVEPSTVLHAGKDAPVAHAALVDTTRRLTTLPGDVYTLRYRIPGAETEYDLFLEAEGYYMEWIRSEWIEEENPALLAEMLLAPEKALTRLAPDYKRVETRMEKQFWESRYEKR